MSTQLVGILFMVFILRALLAKKSFIASQTEFAKLFFPDRNVMTLSPGGYFGFYQMGICTFIKENYDTSNYVFSGASAGAWNALFMTLRTDPRFMKHILVKDYRHKNIFQIEWEMRTSILRYYTAKDFDLSRLCIGVVNVGQTKIYTDFDDLEDVLDCCIASSHIPFVTGNALQGYRNTWAFDGGFSHSPYLCTKESPGLHITPFMWGQNKDGNVNLFRIRSGSSSCFENLFQRGYRDTLLYGQSILNESLPRITQR